MVIHILIWGDVVLCLGD